MRGLRGDPAGRLVGIGIFVLSVAPVRNRQLQYVCSSCRRSFVLGFECVLMSACISACSHVHIYGVSLRACIFLMCVLCSICTLVSICIYMCVCLCLFTNGLCSSSECLIPECVGVFLFRLMQSGEVSASTAAGYQ